MSNEVDNGLFSDELELRLQTKAEAAKWGAERRRNLSKAQPDDYSVRQRDRFFIDKGINQGWYVWMLRDNPAFPNDPRDLETLAENYTAVLNAAKEVRFALSHGLSKEKVSRRVLLLSKCHSALRKAINLCHGHVDPDQLAIHYWLKDFSYNHSFYIKEGMKLRKPISPMKSTDLIRHADAMKLESHGCQTRSLE